MLSLCHITHSYTLVFVIAIVAIGVYGNYRCKHPQYKDVLETRLGDTTLDGWSLTHFFFFGFVGYKYPHTLVLSLGLGVAWELFEHYYGKLRPGWLGGFGDCPNLQSDYNETGNWWYGKWSDVLLNTLGFLLGAWFN